MVRFKDIQNAINWFDIIGEDDQIRIKNECPDSWKKKEMDFYEWVADIYKKQIEEFNGKEEK